MRNAFLPKHLNIASIVFIIAFYQSLVDSNFEARKVDINHERAVLKIFRFVSSVRNIH